MALNALDEIEAVYEENGVALLNGEQRRPSFLAFNEKGKVPVLVADGTAITALPAILLHLHRASPDAGLFAGGDELAVLSDLIWLSGTLHPLADRIMFPRAMSHADEAQIRSAANVLLDLEAALISRQLERAA